MYKYITIMTNLKYVILASINLLLPKNNSHIYNNILMICDEIDFKTKVRTNLLR